MSKCRRWAPSVLVRQSLRVRVGRPARYRVALVVLGVLHPLPIDGDRSVLVVPHPGGTQAGGRTLLVRALALGPPEGLVLRGAVRPVLELRGRILLQRLDLVLGSFPIAALVG